MYLDNPWFKSMFPAVRTSTFTKKFQDKYRKNWQVSSNLVTSYANILRAAPVAAIPDDHEYWNNYPVAGLPWFATFVPGVNNNWAKAARANYNAFQHADDPDDPNSYCYTLNVDPLSFFMLDNRTFREGNLAHMRSMLDSQVDAYNDWIADMLNKPGSVPVLVTGPSLFQPPKGKVKRLTDLNFANVEEYPTVMDGLLRLVEGGRSPLLLTGDVHYPRLSQTRYSPGSRSRPWAPLYEVISSPAALVGLGFPEPLPKGSNPIYDIDTQARAILRCEKLWPAPKVPPMGNNVTLLKFTSQPTGMKLTVRYYAIGAPPWTSDYFDAPDVTLRHASEAQSAPDSFLLTARPPAPAPRTTPDPVRPVPAQQDAEHDPQPEPAPEPDPQPVPAGQAGQPLEEP